MSKVKVILGFLTIITIICSTIPYVVTRVAGYDGVALLTRNFSPIADTVVFEAVPNNNYGSETYLVVRSEVGYNVRTFIRFDLSSIPPGSVIDSALLYLFMNDAPTSSRTVQCHRVTGGSWTEAGITWNNQPDATIYVTSSTTGTSDNVWRNFVVTSSVRKFAFKDSAGYEPNYGWRLKDSVENAATIYRSEYRSREYTDSTKRPYLEVKYYPPHLELELSSSSIQAGNWIKMSVWRVTNDGEYVTRGNLEVDLSSSSTSTNKRFSLTEGGAAVTKVTIPDGSKKADFWYYDDKAGTWDIQVWTDDYAYLISLLPFKMEMNYGDDTESLTVTPGPLHHFTFGTIASPKQVAVPFSIAINACDVYNNVKTDYTGTNSLADTTGTINPVITGAFVNGKWTGMVTINKVGNNVKITTSGAGKTGESNAFNVRAGPPAKLVITPSSFTMAAGVTYSYLNISLRDANNFETTHTSDIIVSLLTTSSDGEFRQFETTTVITGVVIHAGTSFVKVDYYDIKGGTQTLTASATGLTSGTATVTVIPDTTPPVTTMTVGSPKYLSGTTTFVSGSTVFELSASDDASGVKETKYRFDAGSWSTYTAGFTLLVLSDGSHTIGYYSADRSNNNEAEKTLMVMLDKTPPAISGASPTGSLVLGSTSVRFTVRVEDSGSGVKEVRLTVDGVSQGIMTSGSDYSKTISLSEGSHTWSIEALDNVDNVASQSYSFTLTVDAVPPTVSGLSVPSNPVFGESTTITCEVSDALSGVKEVKLYYSTNGGSSWTEAVMTLQAGRYTSSIPSQMPFTSVQYYVKAVDNAGNEYQTPASTFSVGIPMWLYIAVIVIVVILAVALLLRRRKPAPQPTYVPPAYPPPPPSRSA
ncbi:MAG: DNRLRE domain-containing protein [Thermoproteota archaeon]